MSANSVNKEVHVMISGAAGQIGYALLPRLVSGQMFGPETAVHLHLLEVSPAMSALEGVAMELNDGAYPLLKSMQLFDDVTAAAKGIDWAVLVGAMPRKAGMERADLLAKNAAIFSVQGQAINAQANTDAKIFVVGNPCNSNALIAKHHAPDIAPHNIYAMTMLDELRARFQLANKAGVSVNAIKHCVVWGNHSATQYPDAFHATINGQSAAEVIADDAWISDTFLPTVQKRGAAIIKARGLSSAASAANAVLQSIYNITHDTPDDEWYSLACCSDGEYGVDPGLIFSFPCRTENGVVKKVMDLQHNEFSQQKIAATLQELRDERDAIAKLGLLG